jgi:hypothetical protein
MLALPLVPGTQRKAVSAAEEVMDIIKQVVTIVTTQFKASPFLAPA